MKTMCLIAGVLVSPLLLAQHAPDTAKDDISEQAAASANEAESSAQERIADRHCLRYTGSRITADRERRRARDAD
ncbi:hypothetical protein, partial [Salmonella enterica]|uniref:hypothetical protein n=1 Tax=Salmonella enterica TaxID=28901 RepID=UPI0032B57E71